MKKWILLDVDGVLADFVGGYLDLVSEVTGRRYEHKDADQWLVADAIKLSEKEKRDVEFLIGRQGFCQNLRITPGAREGVKALREVTDIVFCTSPWHSSRFWHYERQRWLEQHFHCNIDKELVFTGNKAVIKGTALVDDRMATLEVWKAENPDGLAVLWGNHHNVHDQWVPKISNWSELLDRVKFLT